MSILDDLIFILDDLFIIEMIWCLLLMIWLSFASRRSKKDAKERLSFTEKKNIFKLAHFFSLNIIKCAK